MNRRKFLTATGLASSSLFLPSLFKRAAANPQRVPQRLVIMFTQHGTYYDGYKMRWPNRPETHSWVQDLRSVKEEEFSLGLRPLYQIREHLNIIDGLALVSGEADSVAALRHEIGEAHALTGAMSQSAAGLVFGGGPSIDQRIADTISRPDRLRSLELSVAGFTPPVIYRGAGQVAPAESNPLTAWERVFGLSQGATQNSLLGAQKSILDRVAHSYRSLGGQLSAADRQKLKTHQDLLRDLEKRVTGLSMALCSNATSPLAPDNYQQAFSAQSDIVLSAMACDLVRVASIQLPDIPAEDLGYPGVGVHDEYAHSVHTNPTAQEAMTKWSAFHSRQFVELVNRFASIPEGNGTMLDNTLCIWLSELGDGSHGFERWPAVLAGGANFLKQGQYIYYPSDVPMAGWWWNGIRLKSMAQPHQKLLTTLAQVYGLRDKAGSLLDSMPVKQVSGIANAKISCAGTLKELMKG